MLYFCQCKRIFFFFIVILNYADEEEEEEELNECFLQSHRIIVVGIAVITITSSHSLVTVNESAFFVQSCEAVFNLFHIVSQCCTTPSHNSSPQSIHFRRVIKRTILKEEVLYVREQKIQKSGVMR